MSTNLFQTLQKWDVEFDIGPEMLRSICEYMVSFRHEIYFKLFADRLFLQSRSSDNTQYTDIDIDAIGVQNYQPNIPSGLEERYKNFTREEQIQYRNIYITPEGVHKRVFLNMIDKNPVTPLAELLMFLGKNPVKIRIDTLIEKRIEFVVQRGMFIWWRLMDPVNEDTKAVENMPNVVAKIRNDTSIGKAVLTMEPGLFKRIASLGGKFGKGGNAHTRALLETDINKGLTIGSGDNMRGRVLKLGVLGSNIESYDKLGRQKSNANMYGEEKEIEKEREKEIEKEREKDIEKEREKDIEKEREKDIEKEEVKKEVVVEKPFASSEDENTTDYDDIEEFENDNDIEQDGNMFEDSVRIDNDESGEVPFLTNDDIIGRNKKLDKKKKDKKNKFEDDMIEQDKKKEKRKSNKKEEENIMDEAITNDLTSAEVDVKTQMWMEIPFLAPILKLNGLAPILIEMRNGKPLVVTQSPYPDMLVMLTIAPRIESDDDSD